MALSAAARKGVRDPNRRLVEESIDKLEDALSRSGRRSPALIAEAFEELRDLYLSSDEVVRFRIADALSGVSMEESREILELALRKDDSSLVRHEAAFGLGETGDASTIPLLVEIGLQDSSYLVRHEAAMALARIGDDTALAALEYALDDSNHEVVVSCQLAINSINYREAQGA